MKGVLYDVEAVLGAANPYPYEVVKERLGGLQIGRLQASVFCLPTARVEIAGRILTLFGRLLLSNGFQMEHALGEVLQEIARLEVRTDLNHDELTILSTLQKLRDDITVIEAAWRLGDPDPGSAIFTPLGPP